MATTKKTDSGKPAQKQSAARKPAAKKAAAKKAAPKKAAAKKTAAAPVAKPTKKVSAARSKAKAERKAPEKVPGRKERRGIVVSDAMDKTIVVKRTRKVQHKLYRKYVNRTQVFKAHDEQNAARVGAQVKIAATRPLSRSKRWRLVEIIEQGPEE